MNCMKCKREIALGQVFCKECLADMENYPVKPGTPVILPTQVSTPAPRRSAPRKIRKPEEQITLLKRLLVIVTSLLVLVSRAFALTTALLVSKIDTEEAPSIPGQNYSTEAAEDPF